MKRIVMVCLAVLFMAGTVFCQEMGQGMMQQRRMMRQGMGPMPNVSPQTFMVASGNGGVIILSGNRLFKFDKNLKLLKEVKLFSGNMDKKKMTGMQRPAGIRTR